jgi:ADP-ribosylglycohydrolase
MALALAHSIVEKGWNLNDQARRYVAWFRKGRYSVNGICFDIGNTTATALVQFEISGAAIVSGPTDEFSSGNGSIMRLAPVPIAHAHHYPHNMYMIAQRAAESSLPTHGSDQCISACVALGLITAAILNGESKETVLAPDWQVWQDLTDFYTMEPKIMEVIRGSYRTKHPQEIRGLGHVVASLEAALWAFDSSATFEEAVLKAVNLGDDADTTGAVCGQLAGAYWGESGIPESLLTGLARRDILDPILSGLVS